MHEGETVLTDASKRQMRTTDYRKDYKLARTLGQGSFAKVKIGTCHADGTKWAVKIIDRRGLSKEDADALGVEVETMLRVRHPNIVELKEIYDAHEFVMILELCTGGELFDRIVSYDHYSEERAAHAFAQMAEAIGHCHAHGIVHRDLKPENLLYKAPEPDETLKLADFGLAAVLSDSSMLQTACGTPGYVAPEILANKGYANTVDVWSLGVILYILLCGFPPFYHENNAELFAIIKRGEFDFPSPYWDGVGASAKELITQCLQVDVRKRCDCEAIMKHAWMQGEAVDVHLPHFMGSMKAYNARCARAAGPPFRARDRRFSLSERYPSPPLFSRGAGASSAAPSKRRCWSTNWRPDSAHTRRYAARSPRSGDRLIRGCLHTGTAPLT